jgi:hypothetical protein
MTDDQENPQREPSRSEPEDTERSRFARFAKKLVRVAKEIDEKAEEWKRERDRER